MQEPLNFRCAISDLVVKVIQETYQTLPKNGKPIKRDDGRTEFTILAGIVLIDKTAHDDNHKEENEGKGYTTLCPSLATGMRCLPQEKLSLQGDLLHDSHAEVLVKRGFRLWLYEELKRSYEIGIGSAWINRPSDSKDHFSLKKSVQVFFYVSTLPCGDASMLLTSQQVSEQSRPIKGPEESISSEFSIEYQKSISKSLGTLHVSRGRLGFDQPIGKLRTKPGRIDSPLSTSHSCSDKLALWNVIGLQGALGSSILQPIHISGYVFGTCDVSSQLDLQTLHSSLRYALIDRVKAYLPADHCPPEIWFTFQDFEFSQKSVAKATGTSPELNDRVVSTISRSLSDLHYTFIGLSFVSGYGTEVIDRHGSRQGAPKKRRAPESPLSPKTRFDFWPLSDFCVGIFQRSRLSKLELYRRYTDTLTFLGLRTDHPTKSYNQAKHPQISENEQNSLTQRVLEYQTRKSLLRDLPDAAFYGWIIHGARWENFDIEGRIMSRTEVMET
ncbi:uncharacterized protein MELLADRAFT_89234 [Melampsora larici-populina 98AG31]|uniref:A to I editase domain-containing protein n=1 Tax=Melampsora larici-populina (strain 98AG31 / pathotype 3-4-7) TaxID=747676 RepID=F4R5F9_MELLP|nr:uncharacterized protein MELLADRAFT_89234 [Melampsora larici-populina 98AG31]EGG12269.1 hypothetical protein MELLADRAFT_89234 [Melampsora larici-populina 98AG31]